MPLEHNLAQEPVSVLRLREAVKVRPTTPARDAVAQMRARRLGCAIVVDDSDRPHGVFTEQSVINLLRSRPRDWGDQPVQGYMDPCWASIRQTEPIGNVIATMQADDLRFVVVVDAEGKAVALTGQRGVMEYIAEHFPRQVMVQRVGGHPYFATAEGA